MISFLDEQIILLKRDSKLSSADDGRQSLQTRPIGLAVIWKKIKIIFDLGSGQRVFRILFQTECRSLFFEK